MNRFSGTALITGASSGIGRAYAKRLFLVHEMNLVLVARRETELNLLKDELLREKHRESTAAKQSIRVISTDLIDRASHKDLIMRLEAEALIVNVLINNAGFGSFGRFEAQDTRSELDMIELNCKAPLLLCHHFLPQMKSRGAGLIINVASTVSFQPMPMMATYGATKAFLKNFSLALYTEMKSSGVHVMAHCPGSTSTEFHGIAGLPTDIALIGTQTPEEAVREAIEAAQNGKAVFINGMRNRFLQRISKLLPDNVTSNIVSLLLSNKSKR